jgi:SRSO17 transposase
MVARALDAGVPVAWVVADEVYGGDSKFRGPLEARGQAYVLAVRSNQPVSTWPPYGPPAQHTAAGIAATVRPTEWERLSCGEGAQGPRLYDWAYVPVRPTLRDGWVHAVLVRRHPARGDDVAFYLVYAPATTPLAEVVRAAGSRWTIEDLFKLAKGQVGLDQYEVRSWRGWYRHVTLGLLALAALIVGAQQRGASRQTVPSTSRSRSPRSGACSSGCSGPRPGHRPARGTSSLGRAGAAAINGSPSCAIADAA